MNPTEVTRMRVPVTITARQERDAGGSTLRISGVAAAFGKRSTHLPFIEVLDPGCFRDALPKDDQLLLWAHDDSKPLARKSAGMVLKETSVGLEFDATMPDTSWARDAYEAARSGLVTECSFAFMPGVEEYVRGADGKEELHVRSVKRLLEISLVATPAYGGGSTIAEARSRADTIERVTGVRPRLETTERSAYGPTSPHSWFADRLILARDAGGSKAPEMGSYQATQLDLMGGGDAAAQRMRTLPAATRAGDLTTATHMGEFMGKATPEFIAQAFATAVRQAAFVGQLFNPAGTIMANSLDGGKSVSVPRIDTGATTGVQASENTTVSATDHASSNSQSIVATIAGTTTLSAQLFDHLGAADVVIARDLGAAYAATLDAELVTGANTGGHTEGLLNVAGKTTGTYTDASPTAQELLQALSDLYKATWLARGIPPTHCILSVKNFLTLVVQSDNVSGRYEYDATAPRLPFGPLLVPSGNVPINLGTGSNEGRAIFVVADDLQIYSQDVSFKIADEVLESSLQIIALVYGYAAAQYSRPEGVGVLSGTGLI